MNITDTKKLGAYIKNVRKEQHLTQADLAIAANVGVRFLVDLENGKETAQIGKVINVCRRNSTNWESHKCLSCLRDYNRCKITL